MLTFDLDASAELLVHPPKVLTRLESLSSIQKGTGPSAAVANVVASQYIATADSVICSAHVGT